MTRLADGLSWIDLRFRGRPEAIATGVVQGGGDLALVDPGPTTCIDTLAAGLEAQGRRLDEVTHVLLTHIHLDHAAATGAVVARAPRARVYVHSRGARHLAQPDRLIASATRVWGERMETLWGAFLAVPVDRLVELQGGDRIEVGGRSFEVAATPGHAVHHVSYFDRSSGVAFVGDTAGIRIGGGYVLPATPPPDIDLEAWQASLDRIDRWDPSTLFLTHFGPVHDVRPHLRTLAAHLIEMAAFVRAGLDANGTDDERSQQLAAHLDREFRRGMSDEQRAAYRLAAPPELHWAGLARYWRQRSA